MTAATARLTTTVIGSYPKPDYLADKIPDWFSGTTSHESTKLMTEILNSNGGLGKLEESIQTATQEVLNEQTEMGIDVPTDGELRRENYIYGLLRNLEGISWDVYTKKSCRDGAYETDLPTITSRLRLKSEESETTREWKISQSLCDRPIKVTLPGPITIMDTIANTYYKTEKEAAADVVQILRHEIRALAAAGCRQIQIDEPVWCRMPSAALEWGIDLVNTIFEGVEGVERIVHMCCGYPGYLDDKDYKKACPSIYKKLAKPIDEAENIDAVSLEDAHRHNDEDLFASFKKTKVILGVIAIADSRVESVEEIVDRLNVALRHLPAERLVAAPDCGLALLPKDVLKQKLKNMTLAVEMINLGL